MTTFAKTTTAMNKKIKLLLILIFAVALPLGVLTVAGCYLYVDMATEGKTFDSTEDIPYNRVGLLLGTTKYVAGGKLNAYYKFRIDAATELYKSGKISFILISGDNGHKSYNEPEMMKADLVRNGIPAQKIYLDYAGFRTLDSIIRAKKIFGQTSLTIISQKWHNERAIVLARSQGVNAIGYNSRDAYRISTKTIKNKVRESLARVKAIIDIVIDKQPKFLGEKIEIK